VALLHKHQCGAGFRSQEELGQHDSAYTGCTVSLRDALVIPPVPVVTVARAVVFHTPARMHVNLPVFTVSLGLMLLLWLA
jgi:hypothetical protein